MFSCKHSKVFASRNDAGKIEFHCSKCKKRVVREVDPNPNPLEKSTRERTAWDVTLDIAKDALLAAERAAKIDANMTEQSFIVAISDRFFERSMGMTKVDALQLALTVYREWLTDCDTTFLHKDYDWSISAAHEIADEYMAEYFEPASNC